MAADSDPKSPSHSDKPLRLSDSDHGRSGVPAASTLPVCVRARSNRDCPIAAELVTVTRLSWPVRLGAITDGGAASEPEDGLSARPASVSDDSSHGLNELGPDQSLSVLFLSGWSE